MADAADVLFAQSDNSLAFHPGPNPSRQSVSKGSVDHGSGACRPCAWLYKSRNGCRHGEKCDYCHMCPPGELKRKKRDKLVRRAEEMRQQRLQAPLPRLSGPPPPPFDADATLGPEFSAAFCTPTLAAIGAPAAWTALAAACGASSPPPPPPPVGPSPPPSYFAGLADFEDCTGAGSKRDGAAFFVAHSHLRGDVQAEIVRRAVLSLLAQLIGGSGFF
ncbi:unnamed protein product [Polarella glacialis]|uniref:C3H1-type domain-containing protein n=1 Tax=Polarella glacialis TaxID=89957 RepID=A0A813M192_POLGL|nr:unnamed protein product [Polarella glacialis]